LLSVVAQALLLWFFLCAGEELLPLSSDADEGCKWEIQTDVGWIPYWDPQSQSIDGWHSLLGQRECFDRGEKSLPQTLIYLLKRNFGFKPLSV
jgi:hypothetical protein